MESVQNTALTTTAQLDQIVDNVLCRLEDKVSNESAWSLMKESAVETIAKTMNEKLNEPSLFDKIEEENDLYRQMSVKYHEAAMKKIAAAKKNQYYHLSSDKKLEGEIASIQDALNELW